MLNYLNPDIIFVFVLIGYFIPMLIGFILGKKKIVSIQPLYKIGQKLSDPIIIKVHKWSSKYKMSCMKQSKWLFFFILIFLNNLILVAFVSRILYGIIFFLPLLLTLWTGFAQGVLFSYKGTNPSVPLIYEFGGYLFASVVGIHVGLQILSSLLTHQPFYMQISLKYGLFSILFIFLGAFTEALQLKIASKHVDFSQIDQLDLEKRKDEIMQGLEEDRKMNQ